jgi:hypothetical protein
MSFGPSGDIKNVVNKMCIFNKDVKCIPTVSSGVDNTG